MANQSAPSGPAAIATGKSMPVPVNFWVTPAVVIRPIEALVTGWRPKFVNQRAPSGPAAMAVG